VSRGDDRTRSEAVCWCKKRLYWTMGSATTALRNLIRNEGDSERNPLQVYRCPTSRGFHLGHRPAKGGSKA
jgi:hypothetical protein